MGHQKPLRGVVPGGHNREYPALGSRRTMAGAAGHEAVVDPVRAIPRGRGRAWTYGRETDTPAAGARPGPTVEKRTPVRAGENPGASSPEDGWEVHGGPKPEERRMGSPTLLGAGEQQSRHKRKFESVLSAGRA